MTALTNAALTLGLMVGTLIVIVAIARWIDVAVTTALILAALLIVGLPAWGVGYALGWWA